MHDACPRTYNVCTVAEGAMMEAIQGRVFREGLWYTQGML